MQFSLTNGMNYETSEFSVYHLQFLQKQVILPPHPIFLVTLKKYIESKI